MGYQAMDPWIQKIQDKLGNNDDFLMQRDYWVEFPVILLGFKTLIDVTLTQVTLQEHVSKATSANQSLEQLQLIRDEQSL